MATFQTGTQATITLDEYDILALTGSARLQITIGTRQQFETLSNGVLTFGPFGAVTTVILNGLGNGTYLQAPSNVPVGIVMIDMSAAQIAAPTAAQLAATNVLYQLNAAPYTIYQSNGTALVGFGGGGGSWGGITGTLSSQTDLQTALNAKANAASPSFTGPVTSAGSFIQTPYTITANAVNVAGGEGAVSIAADTTFTFSGSPVAGEYFSATITNTDTLPHLLSFPSCVDMTTGLTVSTGASRLSAGAVHKYIWQYDGTVYRLYSNTSAAGPQVNSQSVAYTTVMADANNIVEHPGTDATARTFTLDSNANVAYPVGTKVVMPNQTGAGALTVAIAGTDTIHLTGTSTAGSRTVASGGCAICLKVSATDWQVGGPGVT